MLRRDFVRGSVATAGLTMAYPAAFASALGLPLGIQLYSVRQQMATDFDGTMAAVAEAGYKEVEAASLPQKSAGEIRAALDRAGLKCVGAHHGFADLHSRFEQTVTYDKELGVSFVVCASSGYRPGATPATPGSHVPMTLDDWHYNADEFNVMADKATALGVEFAYHNHSAEFVMTEGKIPLIELLRLTDPKKVTFEMDCGWVVVGGMNPVDLLREYPTRFSKLHVKDFNFSLNPTTGKKNAKVTELGRGTIDYSPIFVEAARTHHIEHAFVEQEEFDIPWKESLQVDAAYMRKFKG